MRFSRLQNLFLIRPHTQPEYTYTTLLLSVCVVFLFADQNLLSPNLSIIAVEFGYDEKERDSKLGGDLALGFFLVGAPMAIMIGFLADTCNRCILFGIVVILGSICSGATYFTTSYTALFATRVLTGISIGGATPIIFSLLSDYYPGSSRIYTATIIGLATGGGIAFGQLLSGALVQSYGWRLPFMLIALPAILLALLVMLTGTEPSRGNQEEEIICYRKQLLEVYQQNGFRNCPFECPSQGAATIPCNNASSDGETSGLGNYPFECPSQSATTIPCNNASSDGEDYEEYKHCSSDFTTVNIMQSQDVGKSRSSVTASTQRSIGSTPNDIDKSLHEEVLSLEVPYREKIDCSKICIIFHTRTAQLVYLQGIPGCIPWGIVYVYLNDYLSHDRGLTVAAATIIVTMFGIGGLVGQIAGGWFGQYCYNRHKPLQCLLMGISSVLGILPCLYIINGNATSDFPTFCIMSMLAGGLLSV